MTNNYWKHLNFLNSDDFDDCATFQVSKASSSHDSKEKFLPCESLIQITNMAAIP